MTKEPDDQDQGLRSSATDHRGSQDNSDWNKGGLSVPTMQHSMCSWWKSPALNCSGVKFGVLSLLEDCGWCSSAGCLVDLLHVVFITQIYSVVTSQVHVEVCVDFRCVFSVFIGDCYIMAAWACLHFGCWTCSNGLREPRIWLGYVKFTQCWPGARARSHCLSLGPTQCPCGAGWQQDKWAKVLAGDTALHLPRLLFGCGKMVVMLERQATQTGRPFYFLAWNRTMQPCGHAALYVRVVHPFFGSLLL